MNYHLAALALTFLAPTQDAIPITEVLAVEPLGVRRRSAVYTDGLDAVLARGDWVAPSEGDEASSADGSTKSWTRVEAGEDGWFSGRAFRGGWALARVELPAGGAWRLDAAGHSFVRVDGEPHAGDVYSLGTTRVPLAMSAGTHELLFKTGRGRLRATLEPAPAPVYFESKDRTLPDAIRGEAARLWLGQIVANARDEIASGYTVVATLGDSETRTPVPPLLPSSMRKCVVAVNVPAGLAYDDVSVALKLVDGDGATLHETELRLAVREPNQKHSRTFVSEIDGSVQYYAVTPPVELPAEPAALVLTLHGASVEARGQANAYAPKDWAYIIAPTNRRPYGFDWEDWGRLDTMEVLGLAEERFGTDPRRTYLTGHSMGGHGTWNVGVHFPGRFAAIAPSAGWRSFWSYAGGAEFEEGDEVGAMLARAVNPSRTELLERNMLHGGVYVLHGEADDNVPVREAREMRTRLAAFHPNFAYYERAGAGHWWGNACVDWPPLFAFLRENVLPEPSTVRRVEFATLSPGVSSRCDWVVVEAQERWMEPSRVRAKLDADKREIELETENVTRVTLDLARFELAGAGPVTVRVDDAELEVPLGDDGTARVGRGQEGGWRPSSSLGAWYKGPHRMGPFKDAFRHRPVFVYGTLGTPEEDAWSLAKARYDHETWRYRGNGAVDVVADMAFSPERFADRSVILYGNRETNAAWSVLLGTGAFDVTRTELRVGDRTLAGDGLALLAVYPRKDSDVASVGVVSGTGLTGCRVTDQLPYFVSGVAYPDWTVFGVDFLTEGLSGVRGAGFFRSDWSTEEGAEGAWR